MNQSRFIAELMRLLIATDGTEPVFQKRGCQRAPFLISKAARRIISQLPDKAEAVCVLGTSGLALGVLMAHELYVPLYFFKSDGWPRLRDGRTLHVLPEPTKPLRVLLVDSHYRSSYSWAKAENFLRQNTPLEPIAIGLIFHPDTNKPLEECRVPAYSVVKAIEHQELLYDLLGCNSEFELRQMLDVKSRFWGTIRGPTDVGARGRFLRHADALLLPGETLRPHFEVVPIPPNLLARLSRIPMSDPGIWQYYLYPELVRDVAVAIGQNLDLSTFNCFVGASVLGTSIALSLIHYNLADLKDKQVFSSYFEKHLIPRPHRKELVEGEILLSQMRLTTGLLTNDAKKLIEKGKGSCCNLLAIRTDLTIEPGRRKRPLDIAGGRGLKRVYTLTHVV